MQSLKRITCDERGKIGRKNLTTFYIKSLQIWRRKFSGYFRVCRFQRITCHETENQRENKSSSITREERKEERLKSRGKNLRVPRPCPSIIQWRMVLVTGKICDDMFETLMCISNAHYQVPQYNTVKDVKVTRLCSEHLCLDPKCTLPSSCLSIIQWRMSLVTEPLPAYVEHFFGTEEIILSIFFVHQQHAHLLHQDREDIFSENRFFIVMKKGKSGKRSLSIAWLSLNWIL